MDELFKGKKCSLKILSKGHVTLSVKIYKPHRNVQQMFKL